LTRLREAPCEERVPEVQEEKSLEEVSRALEVQGVPEEAVGLERLLEALGEELTVPEALGEEERGLGAQGEEGKGLGVQEEEKVLGALGEVVRALGAPGGEGSGVLAGGGPSPLP